MRPLLHLYLLLLSIVLIACSDQSVLQEFNESKETGSVDFTIKDIGTGAFIDSAKINYTLDGKFTTQYTDSLGNSSVLGLAKGVYRFKFQKAGYTDINLDSIDLTQSLNANMIILTDVDTVVYMHANSVDITGVIKIEDAQGNKIPQAGVIVDLVISAQSGINNIVLVDTTDETGTYSFNNLPERADSYTLTTRAFERDGVKFDRRQLPPMDNLKSGEQLSVTPLIVSLNSQGFEIDDYQKEVESTDTLTITFSSPVDPAKIKREHITVRNADTGNIVAVNWAFNTTNTLMKIAPAMGNWGVGGAYNLTIILTNDQNVSMNETINFLVIDNAIPSTVAGFSPFAGAALDLDYYHTSIELRWNAVPNALGYYIYLKKSTDDNYVRIKEVADGSTVVTTVTGLDFTKARTDSLLVVSYTTNGISDFATAPVIVLTDVTPPTFSTTTLNIYGDLNNSAYAENYTTVTTKIPLPGDIDTTVTPSIRIKSSRVGLTPTMSWLSEDTLSISVIVPAGKSATAFEIDTLVVSGLTDVSKNTALIPFEYPMTFKDLGILGFAPYMNSNQSLDYDDTSINLIWNENSDVSAYHVYIKRAGATTYRGPYNFSPYYDTLNVISGLDLTHGYSDTVKIVGAYGASEGDLDRAPALVLKDVTAPVSTTTQLTIVGDLNNAANPTPDTLLTNISVLLPEDVDTTAVPTLALSGVNSDKFGMSWKWYAPTATTIDLQVTLWTLAGVDASAVTSDKLIISGLTDIAGNATAVDTISVEVTDLTVTGFALSAGEAALIDHAPSSIAVDVEWDPIPGVDGYIIYFKGHGDQSWSVQETVSSLFSSYTVSPLYLTTGEVDSLKITAQMNNGSIESDLSLAPIITLNDVVAPSATLPTMVVATSTDNSAGGSILAVDTVVINFSSDFDDLATINASLLSGTSDFIINATANSSSITLILSVPANTNAVVTSDTVVITGVTDYAGNSTNTLKVPVIVPGPPVTVEGFESWTDGGTWTTTWDSTQAEKNTGLYSLESPDLSTSTGTRDATIDLVVPAGRSEFCFSFKTVSGSTLNDLYFYIDGLSKGSNSLRDGNVSWTQECYPVTAGVTYTLLWRYVKNSTTLGQAYIDDLIFK